MGAGLLLGLTGCDLYQPDVDSMLAPPVLSELQTEVNEALQDVVGQDFRLCYPTGGSYRSPISSSAPSPVKSPMATPSQLTWNSSVSEPSR